MTIDSSTALLPSRPRRRPARCRRAARAADRRLDRVERDLLIVAIGRDAARGLRREVEQRADGAAGLLARAQLEHLAEQHQHRDHRGGLEIDRDAAVGGAEAGGEQAGRERGDHAVELGRAGAERDQREHVEAAVDQRVPAARKNGQPAHSTTGVARTNCRPVRRIVMQRARDAAAHLQRNNRDGEHERRPRTAGVMSSEFRVGPPLRRRRRAAPAPCRRSGNCPGRPGGPPGASGRCRWPPVPAAGASRGVRYRSGSAANFSRQPAQQKWKVCRHARSDGARWRDRPSCRRPDRSPGHVPPSRPRGDRGCPLFGCPCRAPARQR